MEAVVYRKGATTKELQACSSPMHRGSANVLGAMHETPLSPELFYPLVTEQEMVMWTHWLPTSIVFDRALVLSPSTVISTLTRLKAPPEVLEEFHWSWKMDLFETYE